MPDFEFRITPVDQRNGPQGDKEHVVVHGMPAKSTSVWFGSEMLGWCKLGTRQARDLRDALDAALGSADLS